VPGDVEQARSALQEAGAVLNETSLRLPEGLDWSTYERLGQFLGQLGQSYCWWVGDFLNYGEEVFGDDFYQIEDSINLHPQTQANYKSIAKHIPRSRRRGPLKFSTHAEVAYLEPKEREHWLDEAVRNRWTRQQLRDARADAKAGRDTKSGPVGDLAVSSKSGEAMRNTPTGCLPGRGNDSSVNSSRVR
jgi:hypothetical protein